MSREVEIRETKFQTYLRWQREKQLGRIEFLLWLIAGLLAAQFIW